MAKKKYYVVWKGKETGVFSSWDRAKKLVQGFEGAQYKSFISKTEAEKALITKGKILKKRCCLPLKKRHTEFL